MREATRSALADQDMRTSDVDADIRDGTARVQVQVATAQELEMKFEGWTQGCVAKVADINRTQTRLQQLLESARGDGADGAPSVFHS